MMAVGACSMSSDVFCMGTTSLEPPMVVVVGVVLVVLVV